MLKPTINNANINYLGHHQIILSSTCFHSQMIECFECMYQLIFLLGIFLPYIIYVLGLIISELKPVTNINTTASRYTNPVRIPVFYAYLLACIIFIPKNI